MAILSPQDLAIYAPELDLDPGAINAVILRAQTLAEGPQGAHRPLSKQEFAETPILGSNATLRLSRWPIDTNATVTVQVRRSNSGHNAYAYDNNWVTLASGDYVLDEELGEIYIESLAGSGAASSQFSLIGGLGNYPVAGHQAGSFRRRARPQPPRVKVTYTAGFDFQADPLSTDALRIKVAVAGIAAIQQSSLRKGLRQEVLTGFKSVTYDADVADLTAAQPGKGLMHETLQILREYRSREGAA